MGRGSVGAGARFRSWGSTAGLVLAVGFAGLMLVPGLFGLQRYVITGSSMAGTYDKGSLVFSEVVPASQLRVGDVITYTPPADSGVDGLVTHRIAAIQPDKKGDVLRTKGDANRTRDPWRFSLADKTQSRVVASVPFVGYGFAALGIRWVRIAVIGLPALLIAIATLTAMWRRAGEEMLADEAARTGQTSTP